MKEVFIERRDQLLRIAIKEMVNWWIALWKKRAREPFRDRFTREL